MLTEFAETMIKRDLHQMQLWLEQYHQDLPEEFKQDLRIDESYKNMMGSLRHLREHFANQTGASK